MPRKRSTANALKRLLSSATQPIYVLDDQRQVVFCNDAFAAWLQLDEDDVVGRRCDYHAQATESPLDEILASLCPPAEVFAGEAVKQILAVRRQNNTIDQRCIDFIPLTGEDEVAGVISVVGDEVDTTSLASFENEYTADLHRQLSILRSQYAHHYSTEQFIGDSAAIQRVRKQIAVAVAGRCGVLVVGPQGSGREHVARTIHYGDDAENAPAMLPIACPLFDAELLQATVTSFAGRVREQAPEVSFSLLLFDVDQLSDDAQHELVGLLNLPRINIRTIATSRRNMSEMLNDERMSPDLLHLLSTVEIRLPALADRPHDIPHLAQHFLEAGNVGVSKQLSGFAPDALARLVAYPWPNNIDDLADAVAEACRRSDGPLVARSDLPERLEFAAQAAAYPRPAEEAIVLDEMLSDVEREILRRALIAAKGNKAQAARSLGISRARLHRRVEHFGLS